MHVPLVQTESKGEPNVDETSLCSRIRKCCDGVHVDCAGADVNASDEDGGTPLHVAAAMNDVGMTKLLLDHGARVDRFDRLGHSPVQVAGQRGNHAVLRLLEQAPGYTPFCRVTT